MSVPNSSSLGLIAGFLSVTLDSVAVTTAAFDSVDDAVLERAAAGLFVKFDVDGYAGRNWGYLACPVITDIWEVTLRFPPGQVSGTFVMPCFEFLRDACVRRYAFGGISLGFGQCDLCNDRGRVGGVAGMFCDCTRGSFYEEREEIRAQVDAGELDVGQDDIGASSAPVLTEYEDLMMDSMSSSVNAKMVVGSGIDQGVAHSLAQPGCVSCEGTGYLNAGSGVICLCTVDGPVVDIGTCVFRLAKKLGMRVRQSSTSSVDIRAALIGSGYEFCDSSVMERQVLVSACGKHDSDNHVFLVPVGFAHNYETVVPPRGSDFVIVVTVRTFIYSERLEGFSFFSSGNLARRLEGTVCGGQVPSNQFYKPTRFAEAFELAVKFSAQHRLVPAHVYSLDAAVAAVNQNQASGNQRFSLSAEPGAGKTTVLPFRFPSSRVLVVLPTGFDAWCAYKTATGVANLRLVDKRIDNRSKVTYLDSYMAAHMLLKGKLNSVCDILIIDESDSNAGITKCLTEVDFPGLCVVHLSGTAEERVTRTTESFAVEDSTSFPPLAEVDDAISFIASKSAGGRSIVMVPDSVTVTRMLEGLPGAAILGGDTCPDDVDNLLSQQQQDCLILADDSCTRGFNLNLDRVFDFQLVGSVDNRRAITRHEMIQRRMRVGRNKPGAYYHPSVQFAEKAETQYDIFRNNVARAGFGIPLRECSMELDLGSLAHLMVADFEPYIKQQLMVVTSRDSTLSSAESGSRGKSRRSSIAKEVPVWALWASTYIHRPSKPKSRRSGSLDKGESSPFVDGVSYSSTETFSKASSPKGSVEVVRRSWVDAVTPSVGSGTGRVVFPAVREGPVPIDLSLGPGDVDWPEALRLCYVAGEPVPFVIPQAGWRFTRAAGSGVDWVQRLLGVIEEGPRFSAAEFEVVARGWNLLSSRRNFSFARSSDPWADKDLVVFCVEYFSNFIHLS